ncbi:hypothetical protein IV203_017792 [Nitzschia inconspicua]|uniref:Uncharacterized protein n=1 Tax=Nitzschia inconspicua TaxID=303405 RepID=A0A9K3K663_9STRA|nr:hypothetical protein IV203_024874 [Nitzschia inconspicua]KAG7371651.1 hypothetical protein IV203_017792 [Nitzschia inconspicua]
MSPVPDNDDADGLLISSKISYSSATIRQQQQNQKHKQIQEPQATTIVNDNNIHDVISSRRQALQSTLTSSVAVFTTATAAAVSSSMAVVPLPVLAKESSSINTKLLNLSNDELAVKITSDVVDRQFLVTGRLTRELYDESATFTDEIDTYQLDQWMKGTQKLFVANKSHVDLEPNSLQVSNDQVTFRFQETLCFNIPLVYPTVYLSGKVLLKRNPDTGLITSYQEQWDQDVNTVLKSAKLFS